MKQFVLLAAFFCCGFATAAERPNIVWISVEDISSHLGCYGDPNATTPNLDAFSKQGVRYTHAFTPHGVCAPCRTGIITGMYATGLGANHMRSKARLPKSIRLYPEYLREAGYYCTNNSKTDYNLHWDPNAVWDESSKTAHWKNRPRKDQPFFAIFNLTSCHESRIWPKNWQAVVKNLGQEDLHDPNDMVIPDLYPDTPAVRAAHARLQDVITATDRTIGKLLKELEVAELADDTIVIFWSDHGDGFPRAKRWVYDSGTLVPMIARVPEKFRVDGQAEPGTVSDQLINLIDLGPTTLNLAGISVPENMLGQAFLGSQLPKPRKYVYSARDRIDERFDMVRSVRDTRYRYVRNFNPWWPALQHIAYAETSVVRQEMRRLFAEGKLSPKSAQFLQPRRPAEELYDSENDPWELTNLAKDPEYVDQLQRLRNQCDEWQMSVRDAHLIPESILAEEEETVGDRWSILNRPSSGRARTAKLLNLAKLASVADAAAVPVLQRASATGDAAARWWALTGLGNVSNFTPAILNTLKNSAKDPHVAVQVAASRGLYLAGENDLALQILKRALQDDSSMIRHAAMIQLDDMGQDAAAALPAILAIKADKNHGSQNYLRDVQKHVLKKLQP